MAKRKSRRVGVIDFETDPFKYERVPQPFAACLYFGVHDNAVIWGADAAYQLASLIEDLPPCDLYAHNGGKFHFIYLLPFAVRDSVTVINGRVAKMRIGKCTLIDSYLLIPFALAKYKKDDINYDLFEAGVRELHRDLITRYMVSDCRYTLELINRFHELLGKKLTIGGAAIESMRQCGIPLEQQDARHDEKFRPYFFGGRVECFEAGVIKGPITCVDINGAYLNAMRSDHPHGVRYTRQDTLPEMTGAWFAHIIAVSCGALPSRLDSGDLEFPRDERPRHYFTTGWEIAEGLASYALRIIKVVEVLVPDKTINFKKFVDKHYDARLAALRINDTLDALVHKTVGNSGYGKLASNPEKFYDYKLAAIGEYVEDFQWYGDIMGVAFHRRPSSEAAKERGYYDVATAASITGYVRAQLWRGLNAATRPLYCDTDSIICATPGALDIDPQRHGAWKVEKTVKKGGYLAVAGKKMYTLVDTSVKNCEKCGKKCNESPGCKRVKKASKGAQLKSDEIVAISRGECIIWKNAAPSFSLKNGVGFVKREITRKS